MPTPEVRAGTFNVKVTLSHRRAERALRAFLRTVDVALLQEWGKGRDDILDRLEAEGWDWYRAPGGPVVLWRRTVWRKHAGHAVLLAEGRKVEPAKGRRTILPDYIGTLVELEHIETGVIVPFLDLHTPAHVEAGGRLRRGERAVMWRQVVDTAIRVMDGYDGPVFIGGDWNLRILPGTYLWRAMRRAGYVSMWAGRKPHGTFGSRTIDGLFGRTRARRARVLVKVRESDHRPTVGEWRLR